MDIQRQRLIKPITIVKVTKYLKQVISLINKGDIFSLQKLASQHSITNNIATMLVSKGYLKISESGAPVFVKHFESNKEMAVSLIEMVRVYKKETAHKKALLDYNTETSGLGIKINLSSTETDSNTKDDTLDEINLKSLKKPEIQSMLERALNSVQQSKQSDIFDGINNTYKERFELAKAIASGIYNSLVDYQNESIEYLNHRIVFAAADLHDKLISYKKPINNE